jgi:glycosyltransferase involved in cell wall biosynthesis
MFEQRKVIVVLPAFNAARTLRRTYAEIPFDLVDDVILTDDASQDETVDLASELGIAHVLLHGHNRGYGANQKTCYRKALELGADIIVMLHPDYQYTPSLIPLMCALLVRGGCDVVLGSRILGGMALAGGMPRYKYMANRLLTSFQNLILGQRLSEYHTGYRCFSASALHTIDWPSNSDDFVFDNEVLAQCAFHGLVIDELPCPTRYDAESSSISFWRSVRYGCGVLRVCGQYAAARFLSLRVRLFRRLRPRIASVRASDPMYMKTPGGNDGLLD